MNGPDVASGTIVAVLTDEEIIPVGAEVVVDALQGVKCIVHEVKQG